MKYWKYDYDSGVSLGPPSYEQVMKWLKAKKPFIDETIAGANHRIVLKVRTNEPLNLLSKYPPKLQTR